MAQLQIFGGFAGPFPLLCPAFSATAPGNRLAFSPLRFYFIVGGSSVWSPCICEGLFSSFVGCIRDGRGGGQAGLRVTVRSPWSLQLPAYGAFVRGIGSAITCGHGVTVSGVGLC